MFLNMESPTLLLRSQLLTPRGPENKIMVLPCLQSRVYIEQGCFEKVESGKWKRETGNGKHENLCKNVPAQDPHH